MKLNKVEKVKDFKEVDIQIENYSRYHRTNLPSL